MKNVDWTVNPDDYGIRPAGPPDECFYCQTKVGGEHKVECVVRQRTVVIEVKMLIAVKLPESWDSGNIEFKYNESSSCKNNLVQELVSLQKRMDSANNCFCSVGEVAFVREATEEDEDYYQTFAREREK